MLAFTKCILAELSEHFILYCYRAVVRLGCTNLFITEVHSKGIQVLGHTTWRHCIPSTTKRVVGLTLAEKVNLRDGGF